MLLVLGEYIWEQEVIPPAEQWQTGVKNCRKLGEYAADLGLQIALELEPFQLSLVNDVDTMVRFLDDVQPPGGEGEHRRVAPAAGRTCSPRSCGG